MTDLLPSTGNPAPLAIDVVDDDAGRVRLVVAGEIDMSSSDRLAETLDRAVSNSVGPLELDLGRLTFIDSSGLRVLLMAARRIARRGSRLRTVNTPEQVQRLFQLTALDQSIDVV